MNKQKPYETELAKQLQELPLPDIELAWQDMEERLGKKKKRRFIPFFLLKAGIAIGLIATVSVWMYRETVDKHQNFSKQTQSKLSASKTNEKHHHSSATSALSVSKKTADNKEQQITQQQKQVNLPQQKIDSENNLITSVKDNNIRKNNSVNLKASYLQQTGNTSTSINRVKTNTTKLPKKEAENIFEESTATTVNPVNPKKLKNAQQENFGTEDSARRSVDFTQTSIAIAKEITVKDTLASAMDSAKDSSVQAPVTLVKPTDSAKVKSVKTKMRLSVGLAFYQQIPVSGQASSAYNFSGNNTVFTDYIPAIYLRMHYKKWFAEAGFRFAAPLWTNEQEYSRKSIYLNTSKTVVTNSLQLEKMYYHQIPVSVNYNLSSQFSIGTGLSWNYLYSNVTERVTTTQNILTGAYTSETNIAATKGFTDSFFYSNHINLMLQAEYRYKRFGFMLRYSKGLQPYIRFTNAQGEMQQLSQQSLEFIFNIRLWKNFKP